MKKVVSISSDDENGVKYLTFKNTEKVERTVSLSDEGCKFLDAIGADIVLDFDENDELVGIELMGL